MSHDTVIKIYAGQAVHSQPGQTATAEMGAGPLFLDLPGRSQTRSDDEVADAGTAVMADRPAASQR